MKTSNVYFLMAVTLLLIGCKNENKQKEISLSGAFALYPLANQWAEEYNNTHSEDIRFDIQAGGAGKGLTDALSGTVDLGMFSREITQAEKDKGVWWVAVSKDAVVPTISAENPALATLKKRGITQQEFRDIFITQKITNWNQLEGVSVNAKINLYTRSDACGAAATWAAFIKGAQEDLNGVGIYGDPGLEKAVSKDKNGIAFNNIVFVYDTQTGKKRQGVEVIPIDLNDNGTIEEDENFYETLPQILKGISSGKYPSPPARELYFVSKGKPTKKAVLDYLEYLLTDGQKFVANAGYVPLEPAYIKEQLSKINQ